MDKRKVKKITLEFVDGGPDHTYHNIDANFNISNNARKSGGFANLQEWTEFHITWIIYHDLSTPLNSALNPVELSEISQPETKEQAWCSIHSCPPTECFSIHNREAFSGKTFSSAEILRVYNLPVEVDLSVFDEFLDKDG